MKLTPAATNEDNELAGEIRSAAFPGAELIYEISVQGKLLLARTMSDRDALRGKVFIHFPRDRMTLFPDPGAKSPE